MDTIRKLIDEIEKYPAMYIGRQCPERLHLFLLGWLYGKGYDNVPDAKLLSEFREWLGTRFKINTTHSWAEIISFYASDDVAAFRMFFELLHEFESEKAKLG